MSVITAWLDYLLIDKTAISRAADTVIHIINDPMQSTLIHNAHRQTESALLCLLHFAVKMCPVSLFVFISNMKISHGKVNNKTSRHRGIGIRIIAQRKISNTNVSQRKLHCISRNQVSALEELVVGGSMTRPSMSTEEFGIIFYYCVSKK